MKIVITKRHVLLLIVLFSLLGIAISAYDVLYPWGEQESFCDISSTFSCTVVNTCRYARLFGIKIAAIGIAGYSALFAGAAFQLVLGSNAQVRRLMALAASGATIFSLYLTRIEVFVLQVYCPTCLASMASISLILISCWCLYSGKERAALLKQARTVPGLLITLTFIVGGFLAVDFAYALCAHFHPDGQQQPTVPLDEFAKCLTEKGAVMYGTTWCHVCQSQKTLFGESWQYVNFTDCDSDKGAILCDEKRITGYPTWFFADGTSVEGKASISILSAKTGCTFAE